MFRETDVIRKKRRNNFVLQQRLSYHSVVPLTGQAYPCYSTAVMLTINPVNYHTIE